LVEDGIIKQVGSLAELEELVDTETTTIDLTGKTLLPGFIDPHGHIAMMGTMSVMANLRECDSFADIKDVLTRYIAENNLGKDDVLVGFGYDHNFLIEESHPDKFVLNEVSTEIPICISHASGHVGCANDAALEFAGIDETTP